MYIHIAEDALLSGCLCRVRRRPSVSLQVDCLFQSWTHETVNLAPSCFTETQLCRPPFVARGPSPGPGDAQEPEEAVMDGFETLAGRLLPLFPSPFLRFTFDLARPRGGS